MTDRNAPTASPLHKMRAEARHVHVVFGRQLRALVAELRKGDIDAVSLDDLADIADRFEREGRG